MRLIILLLAFLFTSDLTCAAVIGPSAEPECDYHLRGRIAAGDTAKLEAVQSQMGGFVLCLDSPGGSLIEGTRLFEEIWSRDIGTRVLSGENCLSACSIAFLGGSVDEGTSFIRRQERVLEVGGDLGFHAPSLELKNSESYSADEINRAFEIALKSAEGLFSIKQAELHGVSAMNDFLYQRILATRPNSMFHIETIGDAILSNIALAGVKYPARINRSAVTNICDNAWVARSARSRPGNAATREYFNDLAEGGYGKKRTVLIRKDNGYVGKVYDYENPLKFWAYGCYVRLADRKNFSTEDGGITVRFVPYGGDADFDIDAGQDGAIEETVPYWYLLNSATPLSPKRSAGRQADADFVRLTGYDLAGGDIANGLVRNADEETCLGRCRATAACDAATHDRWNNLCVLKSVARSSRRLYILSKADTYVARDQRPSLKPEQHAPVRIFTKSGKGFQGGPDNTIAANTLDACMSACRETACLGFNWIETDRKCQMFDRPGVYTDSANGVAGFKAQPVAE